jgi:hypothetical protein
MLKPIPKPEKNAGGLRPNLSEMKAIKIVVTTRVNPCVTKNKRTSLKYSKIISTTHNVNGTQKRIDRHPSLLRKLSCIHKYHKNARKLLKRKKRYHDQQRFIKLRLFQLLPFRVIRSLRVELGCVFERLNFLANSVIVLVWGVGNCCNHKHLSIGFCFLPHHVPEDWTKPFALPSSCLSSREMWEIQESAEE